MKTQHLPDQNPPLSIPTLLLQLWGHLSSRRRVQLNLLLVVMLASAGAELVSLAAVVPFLAVLSDPDRLWQNPLVQTLTSRMGLTEASQLLLPVTLAFAVAAVLAASTRLMNLWLNCRLSAAVGSDLSCEAYRRTLYQSYQVHVQRNSAAVIRDTTIQIQQTVAGLTAVLELTTAAVVAGGMLIGLLLIDAPVAVAATALFGSAYVFLSITARRELRRNGKKIAEASKQQIKALQEGLGAIRDVLLDGSQPTYVQIYTQSDRPKRLLRAKNRYLAAFPRYSLEALGMVAIAFFGGLLMWQRGSSAVVPLLGSLALGAQRLLPALQQMYVSWATLQGHSTAIQAVLAMLNQPLPPVLSIAEPLPQLDDICLEGVHFRYGLEQPEVLRGLELKIRRGERIGLIGSTGSGKSTMVDLLMGLLEPTTGKVLVNGVDLHHSLYPERLTAWRAAIAHVPQSIYLADTSIAENIAFGVPRHKIDMVRVQEAAQQAQIASFIEANLHGYESFVGEQGIRLSGGQRQRIGIARALYKNAELLVLDEATSALDTATEEAVMATTETLRNHLTIIIIAHRLSTVKTCDRVIKLSQGLIVEDGPPHEVLPVLN